MSFVGGIEGGSTRSLLIICDNKGNNVAAVPGPGTNHWEIGIAECARRIAAMVNTGKAIICIGENVPLVALGLSLSGCDEGPINHDLEMELCRSHPNVAQSYIICNDTIGSLMTASSEGGMVLIAGTGSNAFLKNLNGTTSNCGGWGHFIGDEGSAFYIAKQAIKTIIDDLDHFKDAPFPTQHLYSLMIKHFSVNSRQEMIPHFYKDFNKSFYASFCKTVADAARNGDALSIHIFKEAGLDLARHIHALLPNVQQELVEKNGLNIVCVGSVWKSWPLLKEGFLEGLQKHSIQFQLNLLSLKIPAAYGACYMAADHIKYDLPRSYIDNCEILLTYTQ